MRKEFVRTNTRHGALKLCPWACACIKVYGGYMCFESADDAKTWKAQK